MQRGGDRANELVERLESALVEVRRDASAALMLLKMRNKA